MGIECISDHLANETTSQIQNSTDFNVALENISPTYVCPLLPELTS